MKLSNEAKVGLLVVIVAMSLAFVILIFGEIPFFKPATKTYRVYFDDVAGLSKGSEVRVAGIKSGTVKSVRLKDGKVEVVLEVYRDVTLYRNATAYIGTLGLMGDKYLSVDPGTPEAGVLEEGGVIRYTQGYADTDRLIREMTAAAEAMKLMAQNFQTILAENREDIRALVQNMEMLTRHLDQMVVENRENVRASLTGIRLLVEHLNRTLPQTLASVQRLADTLEAMASENREDIKVAVRNLRELSEDLRSSLPTLVAQLNQLSANLNTVVTENRQDLRTISENLAESSKKLNLILTTLERGEGTLGKLIKDEELYRNIASATKTFAKAGEIAERSNLQVGFRGELYRGGDTKGIATVKLQPDEEKYYLLEIVGNSRGRVYYEEILPDRVVVKKEFKPQFTIQYARIFPIGDKKLVLRGGLKESTGGVGVDVIWNSRLMFFSDLWNAGRKDRPMDKNLKPSLQVGAEYRISGPLYVRVGGDDLLNSRLRGAFVGAGLLFTDNDLKYLLGALRLPLP
ncbi:Mammalian cell entry related domain protein [Thermocrinis albus DSM 14484]|uniref:Mammalian cell entry related domain protein n=1 Tax=Thermocrinis albus (strain DSM 14484 / JCM 11386 / HI 11/12) TaxID=638303 RepID=D3SMN7_THEAH|nr:MlaD family protein [Thermocrinis albus]ADC90017.1 Mammalian cell entry related domain protein [Thermocrinis albus DSM 14484]